ncbi:MAG: ribonuclease [Clostridia bacterium]|nr:ribonuclease [Clostridia bacterium]
MKLGVILTVFAVLVILVNMLTQIFKSFATKSEIPTRVFVLLISLMLTIGTFIAGCSLYAVEIKWYMTFGAVVASFVVAYCAMFGYDNLYGELTKLLKKLLGGDDSASN